MLLGLTDVHKLCTSVFRPRNIFSVMNIGPEEHKKAEERMPFSCSGCKWDLFDQLASSYGLLMDVDWEGIFSSFYETVSMKIKCRVINKFEEKDCSAWTRNCTKSP
jgi:hypothetical protein